jgi:hypothetical protein
MHLSQEACHAQYTDRLACISTHLGIDNDWTMQLLDQDVPPIATLDLAIPMLPDCASTFSIDNPAPSRLYLPTY